MVYKTPPILSLWTLGVIVFVILVSVVMLLELIRRQTSARLKYRLRDWARTNGLSYVPVDSALCPLPKPLDELASLGKTIIQRTHFTDGKGLHLMQIDVDQKESFNLLILRRPAQSPTVGLKPTEAIQSICEAFGLPLAPRQVPGVRFTVMGEDWLATRDLADGMARGLLPGDLSLLRTSHHMVIDFSSRPFDEVELTRMRTLATQMAGVV
jgi:hypothetical protein